MATITADLQKQQFQQRLMRIREGAEHTMGTLYCGEGTERVASRPGTGRAGRAGRGGRANARAAAAIASASQGEARRRARPRGGLISGALLGALAVVAVRYGRFRLSGLALGGPDADILLAMDLVLALSLAFVLGGFLRHAGKSALLGKIAGTLAMALLMHNLVFMAPQLFERVFSADWVRRVQQETTPGSLLLSALPAEPVHG